MKPNKSGGKTSATGKSNEVTAFLRMTQIIASGGELNIVDFIGNHECSDLPPSPFKEDGSMRTGTKASLVKILKEKTKVSSIPDLPQDCLKTAVLVYAMSAIRHWSFHTGEGFGVIAERYRHLLLNDVPPGTDIIHFCCDRHSTTSLKSKPAKVYEVSEQYTALDPKEFFAVSANKANLLSFLCEKWCEDEQLEPGLGSTHLYLGGGFKEETKSVVLTAGSVMDVPALESTQQEADTRIFLHTLYSVQNEEVDRVVIHANDTDIITTCLYYGATHLSDLTELWVRTGQNAYLPIHKMVVALGPSQCCAMPFIHSLSGRDTTSYPYFTVKKAWFKSSMSLDIPALEEFCENPADAITDDLLNQARDLTITVYTSKADHFGGLIWAN
ncbi:Mitochondrial import inner membrane translocase subunit TIM21 [Dissostichus eleginoides]|uniref:Mitochondrial import inner membrane translocase subunit TIM21 n=1 Tax=Dissostichus eleginoides TaxID=100907 RepID=A0AAD9CD29_DISEL|nr:Mitochondrial import inner membrane translocase subunit TIM21 [Dissostichus eleginoides]